MSPRLPSLELYTDNLADRDILMGVRQQTSLRMATEHLDLVAVTTGTEQESPIGCDVEMTGMDACRLIAGLREQSRTCIDAEDGDTVGLQAVAGIQESSVGTQMDISTSPGAHTI